METKEQVLEFIYDTEANAMSRLAEVLSKEEVDNLNEIFFASKGNDNKKIGWGILFNLDIDQQLKDDVIAYYMATCDAVKHLQDMFISYQEIKQEWGNQ